MRSHDDQVDVILDRRGTDFLAGVPDQVMPVAFSPALVRRRSAGFSARSDSSA